MKKETMKCRKEIRLYSWELEELQKQAEKMGLSDSQYLRMLITNRPRDYPEIRQELERMNQEINRIGVNINQITHNNNSCLLYTSYVLCGYDWEGTWKADFWAKDIRDVFIRIEILMRYKCLAYLCLLYTSCKRRKFEAGKWFLLYPGRFYHL